MSVSRPSRRRPRRFRHGAINCSERSLRSPTGVSSSSQRRGGPSWPVRKSHQGAASIPGTNPGRTQRRSWNHAKLSFGAGDRKAQGTARVTSKDRAVSWCTARPPRTGRDIGQGSRPRSICQTQARHRRHEAPSGPALTPTTPYSAACNAPAAFAGFGAPTRSRRSDSDNRPPNAISTGPNQINSTIGL